ncbi:MAG: hypothetical protein IKV75_05015 [Bacteroidales bacterium]|nr:hypothetical protein [Bacteroidales bacterium]
MKKVIESVTYESPKAEVLLLTSEGVLCESGGIHNGFEDGGSIDFGN